MESLVSNGSKLYRYGGSLLRTPVMVSLSSNQRFFRTIGPETGYDLYIGHHTPYTRGNNESATINNAYTATRNSLLYLYNAANNGVCTPYYDMTSWYYEMFAGWVCGSHDFNRGANRDYQFQGGPYVNLNGYAFMSQAAYRFTVPSKYSNYKITQWDIWFHGGCALGFGEVESNVPLFGINNVVKKHSGTIRFYGLLTTSLEVHPAQLMSRLASDGYQVGFDFNNGSFSPTTFSWFPLGNGNWNVVPWNGADGPFWADTVQSAVDTLDRERDVYLHVFSSWNTSGPSPRYLSTNTYAWWQMRGVYGVNSRIWLSPK